MKFKYKKLVPGFIRPIIPVTLRYQGKSVSYEALVDSGAGMCMFPAQIGEILGLDLKKGKKGQMSGVIGKSADVYYHVIELDISGNVTRATVGFTEAYNFDYGFLAQRGMFNCYTVHFFYRKGIVELRPEIHVN